MPVLDGHQPHPPISNGPIEEIGKYEPDLSETENPHYFNKNKMLYDLYVERMTRRLN